MSRKVEVAGIMGPIWFMGWLFTIGFLKLTFFQGLLGLNNLALLYRRLSFKVCRLVKSKYLKQFTDKNENNWNDWWNRLAFNS